MRAYCYHLLAAFSFLGGEAAPLQLPKSRAFPPKKPLLSRSFTGTTDVNTVAGSISATPINGFVDATGYSARFKQPVGIAAYTSGGITYLFVADTGNSAIRLITVTSSCEYRAFFSASGAAFLPV